MLRSGYLPQRKKFFELECKLLSKAYVLSYKSSSDYQEFFTSNTTTLTKAQLSEAVNYNNMKHPFYSCIFHQ